MTNGEELEGSDSQPAESQPSGAESGPEPVPVTAAESDAMDELLEDLIASEEARASEEDVPNESVSDEVSEAGSDPAEPISVEDLVADLERVSTERDQFRDSLMRVQAEFENYRKAVAKREIEARERANDAMVSELLPVLDACDGAVKNGATDVEPVSNQLSQALQRQGIERLDPADAVFDPEQHDAVMHEPSDDVDVPTVAEVLRVGYALKGRVIRPAMVKVKG